jgi:hypothetical protein
MVSSCEHGKEIGFHKKCKFCYKLRDYQLVQNSSALQSLLEQIQTQLVIRHTMQCKRLYNLHHVTYIT